MGVDINQCIIEGRLGADPEERVMTSGSKTVRARLAMRPD